MIRTFNDKRTRQRANGVRAVGLPPEIQHQFELLEAKRALNGSLDRIVPRAA